MSPRFVILHHRQGDGEHWDLMLEHGDGLWTWQLAVDPTCEPMPAIRARRISDHRKAYLTYEGPISQDRGQVVQIDAGAYQFEEPGPSGYRLSLQGVRLNGMYSLLQQGDSWLFSPSPTS